ncbi:unnamed protein product [Microthlaspi erraticum]|uniref:Uncharacterized protein n=1 Tax=Microthlaspi erraticum TaxID=1685480 RepID=A0A6D2ID88_9BRAS|nr:unnamed protein product [Microthlaspi erraticum]
MSLRRGTNRRDTVGNQEELTREDLKASHYKNKKIRGNLGFKEFKSPKIRVEFADLSCMEPYGMLEDVMMEIGGR